MIKFFRKIRQRLLTENKFNKYLLYAIGEIVLVVIGILIALQINNWNENRKLQTTKQNYFKQLLVDLEIDKKYAKSFIGNLDSSITKFDNYNEIFKESDLPFYSIMRKMGDNSFMTINLEFKTSTIKTLINTGDIKYLKPKLRESLTSYDGNKTQALKVYAENGFDARNILQSATMEGAASAGVGRFNNQSELKRITDYENRLPDIFLKLDAYLIWKKTGDLRTIDMLDELIQDADSSITLIQQEIKE